MTYCTCCWPTEVPILKSIPSFVEAKDDHFTINGMRVDYDYNAAPTAIPKLYCVRTFDGYWRFDAGFDLLDSGEIWVGLDDRRFDRVEDAFEHITAHLGHSDWKLFLEEPF